MTRRRDTHKAEAKAILEKKGLSLADVDRKHRLPVGSCSAALRFPHRRGEAALAEELGISAQHLWPTRYHPDGSRKRPQPAANYRRRPRRGHRQKGSAA
jgi:Ner family transcriptional regulator